MNTRDKGRPLFRACPDPVVEEHWYRYGAGQSLDAFLTSFLMPPVYANAAWPDMQARIVAVAKTRGILPISY